MAEHLARLTAALADRYEIERELGGGGMATVYLARDLKHDREVAIKVLRPELAAAVGPDRFLREIRITAKLNHPHVLPLLDSGQAGGLLYYVMPLVSGGSLRQRLGGEERLPLDVTLAIARQVASALDHAHRLGVIHRDVKPENILFSEGHAIVADFGVARALSGADREALTRTGVLIGTPGYMSPEQATAPMAVDERTDVYGLACVVYEILVGEPPGLWPTDEAVRLGRFLDATPEHRPRLDDLPGRIEQALVRALAMRPADRFPTPGDFVTALMEAAEDRQEYSDRELREILARAAQLQVEHPTEEGAHSIGSLEQIAADVGIPPERVREAVAQLEGRKSPGRITRTRPGVPTHETKRLLIERTVAREVPETAYVGMVEEIRATLGTVGYVSLFFGGSLAWKTTPTDEPGRNIEITVAAHGGQTIIRIEERLDLAGARALMPALGAAGGGLLGILISVALGGNDWAVLIPGGLLALWGGVLTASTLIGNDRKRRTPELEALADRLATLAERASRA
jgi:serine/threonine protein kinase